jgi:hypothetical protein
VKKRRIIGLLGIAAIAALTGCVVVGVGGPGLGFEIPVFPPGSLIETRPPMPAPDYVWIRQNSVAPNTPTPHFLERASTYRVRNALALAKYA